MSDKGRILVVDDDRAIRTLVAKIVERAGFPVDTALDGGEAIQKINETRYAVCVVDLMMPNVSGYDFVEYIREHCLDYRPAVIVITAVADSSAILPLDGRIVHSVVRKPFDIGVLADLITATALTMQTAEETKQDDREDDSDDESRVVQFPGK
jgi:DNA-binding response OmpR family regulator